MLKLSKQEKLKLPQKFSNISELNFSPDSYLLAVSESNGTINLLNLENKQKLTSFIVERANVDQFGSFVRKNYGSLSQGISFSRDGKWLAIGGDNNITVHSCYGQEIAEFPEDSSPKEEGEVVPNWVQATAFDPSGNLLATGLQLR